MAGKSISSIEESFYLFVMQCFLNLITIGPLGVQIDFWI